ncbi:5'-nucleotidase C-terminal domain-containing protein [Clostridium sp. YIM B02515]|uniref:5'-nucleotidase C-terminal domain-containing protein n=1 Tax=Clostridium rhizosphaerae TaxID=2803861 RepID=A0ABS1T849_9CLOT|nr:5'-nucleotidase C-terminal domain-containing protein [Clostridium rhizosphaerae]MBL4935441.1 5'-nucleotidase C-terminal domain-containing protein [Clostridium rhizosphaerae]
MIKTKKFKILSWVMTLALIISNFIGMGPLQIAKAETLTVLNEGFDGVTNVAPANWTFIGTVGTYTTTGNYGKTSPSLKFAASNNQLVSPSFNLTSQAALSFWIKGQSTDTNSHLFVEKSDGTTWSSVEDIKPLPTTGTTKTYILDSSTKQIRFTYTKSVGNLSLDDVVITQEAVSAPVNVTGATLDKNTLSLKPGETSQLTATVLPSNASNKNITWSTDNPAVAIVTNGLVKGVSEGKATITATTEDGGFKSLCVVTVTANAPPTNKTFDIVEITDFHGQLLDSTNTKPVGAGLAYLVKQVKASNPDRTLIIGGGDLYQGTPTSNVLQGVPVQQVMSNIGMEVTALGNHEFDWGLNTIINKTMTGANYEIVSANMYNKGTNTRTFNPYKIVTKDGVRIAVIGAILKDAPTIILPANVKDYDFRDVATEVNAAAKEIRDNNKADIVLAVIHDGGDSLNTIVNNLHGVDAVFGGHTHTTYDGVNKDADGKDVPTLNAASSGKGYIDFKITMDGTTKALTYSSKGSNWNSFTATTTSPTDPDCKKIVDDASAALLPIFNEVIGHDDVAYTKDQVDSPYGESQLGNWMADVVKNYANADVGMVNNGGIRLSPVPAGDITVGTIFNLMPFDNTVCNVTMTGAQLKYLLEQAVQDNGKGIQISGVKFVYDSTKPSYKPAVVAADGTITSPEVLGQRVQSITRESDNTPVKDADILKVAAPDFVATGGDTFTGFLVPSIASTLVDSHYTVRDALNADVRAKDKITVVMNNRIDNQMAVVAPTAMSIAEARTTTKTAVILTGTVSAVNGYNVFMQDDTAGICVYNSGGKVFSAKKGDKIKVTGNLSTFNGLLEVTPTSAANVVLVSSGNAVAPKVVTVNGVTNQIQGQLVQLKGLTIDSIDNAGATMAHDSTGSINIYKMPTVTGLVVGDVVDVTGAVTCYGTTMELAVDSAADVVKTTQAPTGATISIIGTSDLHGAIYPMDYNTGAATNVGLARISTYMNNLRASNPYTMLIDNGDTIQGTPLVYYYNMIDKTAEYPMMKVMGAMHYDSWTLGNHEFNYGLETLNRVIADANKNNITVLSANTYNNADNTNFVRPYYYKDLVVNGHRTRVGILGLTTKTIPSWEDPAHYAGLQFNDLVAEAQKWVPVMRNTEKCDVVIVAAHTGVSGASDTIPENQADLIAKQVSGIDAILAGHAHAGKTYTYGNPDGKNVTIVEPKNGDGIFSRIDLNIDAQGNYTGLSAYNVDTSKDNTLVADPNILSLAKPYQDATLAYTNTVIGKSTGEFTGAGQTTGPTAIMELINKVQTSAAGSELSIAAPLSASARIPQGDIKRQDIMGVYVYENFLFGVNMTGKQLKNWMEWSVRYYKQTAGAGDSIVKDPVLNIADYNLDQLYGATYDIDLSQPACTADASGLVVSGNRIKNLRVNGKLVNDTDTFKVAINNYRYNGGGGFMAAAGLIPGSAATTAATYYDSAKALGDDGQVRNMMFKYVQDNGTISPTNSNNWKISTTPVAQAKPETISIVGTSDLHGAIYPMDYNTGAAANVGLARISTYMNNLRAANPNTMLIDNGDTIQGTPLVYYYNMIDKTAEYPMMKVMGAMHYDSWTLGNHEFNYGLETLNRVIADAYKNNISVLSANTYKTADNSNFVNPYFIKTFTINGKTLKVGVLGLTTKTIPSWEDPAHYAGLQFNDLVTEAQKWVPVMRNTEKCDVVIVAAHTGVSGASDTIPENQADLIAKNVSGIDAILAGHAHAGKTYTYTNPDGRNVTIVEPKNGDGIFSQIDISIDVDGNLAGINAKNVDTSKDNTLVADPAILAVAQPYQDKTLEYTNTVIGKSTGEFTGAGQTTGPTAIMELINKVQTSAAGSELSIAAPLSASARIPQGDIKRQDIMGVYVYENFLFGVNMTGKQLKNWMEWSVRYYKQTTNASDPIVKDPVLNIADYNLDQLYGAIYDIDLSQPACTTDSTGLVVSGSRIKNLKFNGKLVKDTDVFKVAINNYRYNGGGGFMAAAGLIPGSAATTAATYYDSAKALGDDGQVRNMMFKYVQDNGTISPTNSNNWKISATPVTNVVPVTGVKLDKTLITIKTGTTAALVASVNPDNATNKKVAWKSSNESIATVDDNGVVTGILPGTAIITATTEDGGYTAKANVEVQKVAVKSVKLNSSSIIMTSSQTSKLIAAINPSNATFKDVIWTIQDNSIAQIKGIGNTATITPVHFGTTTVTVRTVDGNFTDSCKIIVLPSLAGKLTALTQAEALLVN